MYKTEKPKQSPIPSKLWIVTQSIVETRRKFLCYCQSKLQSQSWVYAVIAPKIKPWMTSHFLDNCATHLDLLRTDLIRAGTGRQVALGGAPRHLAQCAWRCRVAKQLATLQWHQLRLRYVFAICITNKKFLLVHNVQYFHWFTFCLCLSNRSKYQINQKLKLGLLRCAISASRTKKHLSCPQYAIFSFIESFFDLHFVLHLSNHSKSLNQFINSYSFLNE